MSDGWKNWFVLCGWIELMALLISAGVAFHNHNYHPVSVLVTMLWTTAVLVGLTVLGIAAEVMDL